MSSHRTLRPLALALVLGLVQAVPAWASPSADGEAVVRQAHRGKVEFNAPMQVKCEWRSDHVPATSGAVNGALRKHGFVFSTQVSKPSATTKAAYVMSARKIGVMSEKDLAALVQEVETASGTIGAFTWSVAQK